MAQAGDLIGPKDMEEPNCPQDGNGIGVEQVEQVLVLRAMWNCNGLAPFVRLGPLKPLKSTKYQRQTQRRQC